MLQTLTSDLTNSRLPKLMPGQSPLYIAGLLLCLSGFLHTVVYLCDGGGWEGPLSWRKPILFGFSGGVTCWSMGYVLGLLQSRGMMFSWWGLSGWLFALTIVPEVALITMQTWRGVPSHFNNLTSFGEAVYLWMGILIAVDTVIILAVAIGCLWPLRTSAANALAVRSGLWLLVVGTFLGWVINTIGDSLQAAGQSPEIYGASGVLKFPHGMPLHAIQVLPLWSFALAWVGWSSRWQWWGVALAICGYVLLTIYSLLQTFAGRARMDIGSISGVVLGLGLLGFAIAGGMVVWKLGGRWLHTKPMSPTGTES